MNTKKNILIIKQSKLLNISQTQNFLQVRGNIWILNFKKKMEGEFCKYIIRLYLLSITAYDHEIGVCKYVKYTCKLKN